jgi:hypothetical protein
MMVMPYNNDKSKYIHMKTYLIIALIGSITYLKAQNTITIYGKVTDKGSQKVLPYVAIQVQNSNFGTSTSLHGTFSLKISYKKHISLLFKLLGYTNRVKEIDLPENQDSIYMDIALTQSYKPIDTVSVYSSLKPDTLVGSPKYSIYDFDFYEDKYILLTADKSLEKADLKLADANGKIITHYNVPEEGGEAKEFYRDYMGYTNLICKNYVYRINMYYDRFVLIALSIEDVNTYIKPILDTINGKLIYTDYWKDYPLFNYYSYNEKDSSKKQLHTVEDPELMHAYNFEYYSMMPKEKLAARTISHGTKSR